MNSLEQLTMVLVTPRNPLNIGAVARAMSNFGCFDLRVVAVHNTEFRTAASAVGPAAEILARARDFATLSDAVDDCHQVVGTVGRTVGPTVGRTTRVSQPLVPVAVAQAAPAIRARLQSPAAARVALLFGSEKFGLGNDALSLCNQLVTIPTRDEHASMNLGQAAAVCLYELARTEAVAPAAPDLPSCGDLERFTGLLTEVLTASGQPGMETAFRARRLRALVRRLSVPGTDVAVWLGFLRQVLWRLRRLPADDRQHFPCRTTNQPREAPYDPAPDSDVGRPADDHDVRLDRP